MASLFSRLTDSESRPLAVESPASSSSIPKPYGELVRSTEEALQLALTHSEDFIRDTENLGTNTGIWLKEQLASAQKSCDTLMERQRNGTHPYVLSLYVDDLHWTADNLFYQKLPLLADRNNGSSWSDADRDRWNLCRAKFWDLRSKTADYSDSLKGWETGSGFPLTSSAMETRSLNGDSPGTAKTIKEALELALSHNQKFIRRCTEKADIPYRDHTLTWLEEQNASLDKSWRSFQERGGFEASAEIIDFYLNEVCATARKVRKQKLPQLFPDRSVHRSRSYADPGEWLLCRDHFDNLVEETLLGRDHYLPYEARLRLTEV